MLESRKEKLTQQTKGQQMLDSMFSEAVKREPERVYLQQRYARI